METQTIITNELDGYNQLRYVHVVQDAEGLGFFGGSVVLWRRSMAIFEESHNPLGHASLATGLLQIYF